MVVCDAHDWTVPVQVLQLHPYSALHAVCVVFAVQGWIVPVHVDDVDDQ